MPNPEAKPVLHLKHATRFKCKCGETIQFAHGRTIRKCDGCGMTHKRRTSPTLKATRNPHPVVPIRTDPAHDRVLRSEPITPFEFRISGVLRVTGGDQLYGLERTTYVHCPLCTWSGKEALATEHYQKHMNGIARQEERGAWKEKRDGTT